MAPLIDRLLAPAFARYLQNLSTGTGGTTRTHSGEYVSQESFFQLVPIRSAISVLSQDVSALPLKLYRSEGRGRVEVLDHPLTECLKYTPNPRMTALELREAMMVSLLTWGNFYAYKQLDEDGRTAQLWPLRPDNMSVNVDSETGQLVYLYRPTTPGIDETPFFASEILHIKGLSSDGLLGRSPLYDYREKLGEIAAQERFTQSFFGNGMKRSGLLRHPGKLSADAQSRLRKSVLDAAGADKAFGVMVLEEGMDFSELTFAPEDAQLLESRRFSVEDACRIFALPPYKLRMNTPGTVSYASVDAQQIDYLVSTLTPWLVRIENAINVSCLTPYERMDGMFVEHNTRALLRADLKAQAEALEIGRRNRWYSVNDCREKLGENPITLPDGSPDERGDDYYDAMPWTGETPAPAGGETQELDDTASDTFDTVDE